MRDRGRPPGTPVWFVGGYFVSRTGAAIGLLGLTFAVIRDDDLSPHLGTILATRAAASLLALAVVGSFVRERRARPLLVGLHLLYGLGQVLLAAHLLQDEARFAWVLVLVSLMGVVDGLFIPTNAVFVRLLGQGTTLTRINALVATSASSSKIAGAAVGGALLATLSAPVLILVNAAAEVVHAAAVLATRPSVAPTAPPRSRARSTSARVRRSAVRELRSKRWIIVVAAQATLINVLAWSPYTVLGPQLSDSVYGGAWVWAALSGAYGVGAVLTGLALSWKPSRSLLRVIVVAFPLWCAPLAGLAVGAPLGLVVVAAATAGVGTSLFNVAWTSVLQQNVKTANLSQIISWVSIGPQVVAPVGLLLAGTVHGVRGQMAALGAGALVALITSCAVAAAPSVRRFMRAEAAAR